MILSPSQRDYLFLFKSNKSSREKILRNNSQKNEGYHGRAADLNKSDSNRYALFKSHQKYIVPAFLAKDYWAARITQGTIDL